MVRFAWTALILALFSGSLHAQDYIGGGSFGSSEPLFTYDDPEPWKHGYLQIMPYYGGYHSGRPYNYHHVFSQTQTSVGWGMPHGTPYSQQWWHNYEHMADPGRAQTEPNGYLGQSQPQQQPQWPTQQWTAQQQQQQWAPQPQYIAAPPQQVFAQEDMIAPVQFQQPQLPMITPRGVDPATAATQSNEMRQYLGGPSLR